MIVKSKVKSKLKTITVIEHMVNGRERRKIWYAKQLSYSITDGVSGFNHVLKGKQIPNVRRRVILAKLLGVKINSLWKFDDVTGEIIAKTIGERIK